MPKTSFTCGLDAALAVVGGKWKPLILFHLAPGKIRYASLRRQVGSVSDKMLSQQLRELEDDGVVERVDHQEIPPRVDYSLSPFGRSLAQALVPLCVWGTDHMNKIDKLVVRRSASKVRRERPASPPPG
jgi:DNA-binding HxlR family transcriptional regulator